MIWEELYGKLESYRELKDNWDSHGAKGPTSEQLDEACRVARVLCVLGFPCPDEVNLDCSGTALVDWDRGSTWAQMDLVESGTTWACGQDDHAS